MELTFVVELILVIKETLTELTFVVEHMTVIKETPMELTSLDGVNVKNNWL
jgi:hypothetical protein